MLYAIAQMLSDSFQSFDNAAKATFETVEVVAAISKHQLIDLSH